VQPPAVVPERTSTLRGCLEGFTGALYAPVRTLAEAKATDDGVVVLEAEWGGQILVVARAAMVACDETALCRLLLDLDELTCPEDELEGTALCFERAPVGTGIAGGMGGGRVSEDVWVHAELVQAGLEPGVRAVIAGRLRRLPEPDPPVEPAVRECILRAYRERLPATGIHFGWAWPEGWEHLHRDEICRRQDDEIPPRADGERWYGATIRGVVRQAGLPPWTRPSRRGN
jgi:hypothetical protein